MLPGSEAPQLLESLEKAGAIREQKATSNKINHHPDQREAAKETLGVSWKPQEATEASIKSVSASRSSAAGADIVKDYTFTTQQGQTGPTDPASDLSNASNDESSEDALLRQEMINYALHPPPHNIVAVMNLDDQVKSQSDKVNGDHHFEDDDDYDYSDELVGDEDEDVDDEEEEDSEDDVDSHGRTSSTILDERYIKRMEALQKKLGASDIKNIGPSAEPAPTQGKSPSETDSSKPTEQAEMSPLKAKKSVHFADNIDVATSSPRGSNPTASVPRTTRPISNDIQKQKPSTSNPLSSTILERTPNPVQQPPSPATGLEANELATEYHRVRNRLIQREGGFVRTNDEEPETVPLEQPGAKKISRFRAARVGGAAANPPRF
ncbi:MAG: hypothetical protein M1825_005254 [Sarcosagium campestre]|nr:MAG: hypothetical protein M1825_005254 [Sarcosagium campestre]